MAVSRIDYNREAMITFAAQVANKVVGFIGIVIFARQFSLAGFGTSYLTLAIGYSLLVGVQSNKRALQRRIAASNDNLGYYLSSSLAISGSYVAIISLLLLAFLSELTSIPEKFTLSLCVLMLGKTLHIISMGVYSGLGNPGAANIADAIEGIITLLAQITLLHLGYGPESVVLGVGIGGLVSGAALFTLIDPSLSLSKRHFREFVSFVSRDSLGSFVGVLNDKFPVFAFSSFVGPEAVSWFEASHRLSVPGSMISNAISQNTLVKGTEISETETSYSTYVSEVSATSTILIIPMLAGGLTIGDQLMRVVFGSNFSGTGAVLSSVLFLFLIRSYYKVYRAVLLSSDRPLKSSISNVIYAVVGIPLFVVALEMTSSVYLPILVLSVPEALRVAYTGYVIKTELGGPLVNVRRLSVQVVSALSIVPVTRWVQMSVASEVYGTGIAIMAGGFLYFVLLITLSTEDRRKLLNFVQ